MLRIRRSRGQRIIVGDDVIVEVLAVTAADCLLGITAPEDVDVDREEIIEAIGTGETPAEARARLRAERPLRRGGNGV